MNFLARVQIFCSETNSATTLQQEYTRLPPSWVDLLNKQLFFFDPKIVTEIGTFLFGIMGNKRNI